MSRSKLILDGRRIMTINDGQVRILPGKEQYTSNEMEEIQRLFQEGSIEEIHNLVTGNKK